MRLIGILGGAFDPIHNAHLRLAIEAQEQLRLDHIRFIPVNIPPHRQKPVASKVDRQHMIEITIKDNPLFCIDCRELKKEETSYTINTLKSLKQDFSNDSLCLILGHDAFNKLDSWKDWQELLDYAHIVVANRPNESLNNTSTELQTYIEKHQTKDKTKLEKKSSGFIYFITIPMLDISSSIIRERYNKNKSVDDLLPTSVQHYIKDNHLYLDTA